mmetsp:Transcript_3502/g.11485  ORF Transcript_3502/g.11485 Transcript_3502/m.11485 type:complete len:180 (+) Transcript_3502:49-588(+)
MVAPPAERSQSRTSLVHEEDILLCFGCYCCNAGLYSKDYLGCATELTLCCVEALCCLKAGEDPIWCKVGGGPGKCARIGLGLCSLGIVYPRACCVSHGHLCCLGYGGIVPTDDEFPRTCTFCGLMCRPTCGLCPRLSDVKRGPWKADQHPEVETTQPSRQQPPPQRGTSTTTTTSQDLV